MSDNARESFTSKASKAMTPDSQKSDGESLTDSLKGKADSMASTLQPESQKSTTQKMGDSMSGNSNQNDKSLLDSAKDAMGMGGNGK